MRRITSLVMIVALLSITSIPLLPQTAQGSAYRVSCHSEPSTGLMPAGEDHAHMMHGSSMEMQHSMEHNNHHDKHGSMMHNDSPEHNGHDHQLNDHQNIDPHNGIHKQKKRLTAAERECRIECACGCNRSVDGFPQVLSPHVTPSTDFETDEQIVRIEPETFPALQSIEWTVPLPPPKQT